MWLTLILFDTLKKAFAMEITVKETAGITFVYLSGSLMSTTASDVMDELVRIVKSGGNKIVLNLGEVPFISSAGLRSILVPAKLLNSSSGEILICCTNETVKNVLESSGFTHLVKVFPDESTAVSAFA